MTVIDEASLFRACAAGRVPRAQDGEELVVEGSLVRELCRRDREEIDPRGLAIERARIGGDLDLSGMEISFPLRFTDCVFDRPVHLDGADLHMLAFDGCTIPGVMANGLRVRRDLDLSRSHITGDLWTSASTSCSAAVWLCESEIAGFVYDRFDGAWDWRARRDWLRGMVPFDAGPYEQAARVFRRHGHSVEAERLLIEQRRQARRAPSPGGRSPRRVIRNARDLLYGLTVGYGYRPGRVLWLLGALLALVGVMMLSPAVQQTLRATDPRGNVYVVDGRLVTVDDVATPEDGTATAAGRDARPGPCGDGQVRCFDPLFYTVDTVVPLISLGQRATWYPETRSPAGAMVSALLNVAGLLGWLLSTVVVLSFARLARPV